MNAKRTDNANKTAMPDNNITLGNMENGPAIPSIRVLAMLAAAMDAGPDDALRHWLETARMVDSLNALPPEKRAAVLNLCGRKFHLNDGFEQDEEWDPPKDLASALSRATVLYSVPDAMEKLGIATEKTFLKLVRYTWNDAEVSEAHIIKSADKVIREIQETGKIGEELMDRLRLAQREKKAEAAKKNRANASRGRRGKNPVK